MCGLSVVVDAPGGGGVRPLLAMHGCIAHRGPDGEGFCLLDGAYTVHDAPAAEQLEALEREGSRVGFAFRWLQIQDRSAGSAQPMASADGSLRLVFNGEIYNFRALREELAALGHAFRTASDTEVILSAYAQWGTAMFDRLDGMWALALLDAPARRLVLSRDRFGIKPLYYARHQGRWLFASEVKQLLAAGVRPEANRDAVARFIPGARPADVEQTFFAEAMAHPAAAYCEIDLRSPDAQLRFRPYWRLPDAQADLTYDEAKERLDQVLRSTVEAHMAAQVPVGVLASGGLDSGVVAALSTGAFAKRAQKPVAFSMVLAPGEAQDESAAIAQLREALGFEGFTTTFEAAALRSGMEALSRAQEEPVAGMAVGGQYATLALAGAHGVRVVLDGQGSDEVFAGYPRHQYARVSDRMRSGAWVSALAEAGAILWRDPAMLRRMRTAGPAAARLLREARPRDRPQPTSLADTLRRDVLQGNLRWVLGVTDRNAMAHSIEARVPYVSRAVVELAFSLPERFKVGAGWRKRILRDVALRHLPAPIVRRKARVGFGVPGLRWLRGTFAADLRALASGPAVAGGTLLDADEVTRFVDAFLSGAHDDGGTAWRLYAVDRWARAYSVTGL